MICCNLIPVVIKSNFSIICDQWLYLVSSCRSAVQSDGLTITMGQWRWAKLVAGKMKYILKPYANTSITTAADVLLHPYWQWMLCLGLIKEPWSQDLKNIIANCLFWVRLTILQGTSKKKKITVPSGPWKNVQLFFFFSPEKVCDSS